MRKYDHEFVTTHPRNGVALAKRAGQAFGHYTQQIVSHCVSKRIVYILESVQINEHDGDLPALPPRLRDRLRESILQQSPVRKPGEYVVQREMAGTFFGPQPFIDFLFELGDSAGQLFGPGYHALFELLV